MENIVSTIFSLVGSYAWIIAGVIAAVFYKSFLRIFGVIMIPEDSIGVVNKKFVLFGSHKSLPDGRIVALQGEAGFQADTLAPGIYFLYWPWQYEIQTVKFFNIPQGYVGVVESKDGNAIPVGRVLGKAIDCDSFQDTRKFLENGGERGPQIKVVPPGLYRVNTAIFTITQEEALQIGANMVGIVTVNEGAPLEAGEIAGPKVDGHNSFQDAQAFVANGGKKGLQEQVMLSGTYYVNPRFLSVSEVAMTEVSIGYVGVVVSYVGSSNEDISGEGFQHGNLVKRGDKGVWADVLDPGKYPINPHTHKVELVPTTNIVLNWAEAKTESHKLDENLSTITVRSSDGFTFNLDVSQIIHVSRTNAPKVIARFGNMNNLVTQVLEPLIGNYFRNSAQSADVIGFLQERSKRQIEAKEHIETALRTYDVQAVDTLVGDIVPPEELMKTLTDRKVAASQKETYATQREAEAERQKLEEQTALANTRKDVVTAERRVQVAENDSKAAVFVAKGEAEAKTINAEADAKVLITVGDATAKKVAAVGGAEAEVLRKKAEYVGPNAYALMAIAKDLAESGVSLVPEIMVNGGSDGKSGGLIDAFLGVSLQRLASEAAGDTRVANTTKKPGQEVPALTEATSTSHESATQEVPPAPDSAEASQQ